MKVVFSDKAKKFFLKLDTPIQKQIQKFILKLEGMSDPRASGKMLVGNLLGFWRYRVGDYRLLHHRLRLYRREYVFERAALLRRAVKCKKAT